MKKGPLAIFVIIMLALIIGACYLGFQYLKEQQVRQFQQPAGTTNQGIRRIDVTVADNKLKSDDGTDTVTASLGDQVQLNVTGAGQQRQAELHIDGYDLHTSIERGGYKSLEFDAHTAGSFTITLRDIVRGQDTTPRVVGQLVVEE
ncbi:hypothetical protein JNJ66_03670 [Candidatus Saccharibacteria bacterium]|nr:hypothetical protein [Candidatus Saccharibacteria bacterium]